MNQRHPRVPGHTVQRSRHRAECMGSGPGGPRTAASARLASTDGGADSLHRVVLFASYSGAFGGAERLLVQFAAGLEEDCALACPEGPLAVAARAAGLRVFPIPVRRMELRASATERALAVGRLVAHGLELRRLARALGPELVVAWGMRSALAWWSSRGPAPFAFQHNDLVPGPAIGLGVRAAARRAAVVTAPSRAVAADLDPGSRLGDRMTVVHPGIDVGRFDGTAQPAAPREVLVLGAVAGWKRPDVALEAVAIARRSLPELRLRFVGAALDDAGRALVRRLRSRASEGDLAGAVEFAGATDDPRIDLGRASCLLHCAEAEPFGIAVLEALAAGRPAIVPNSAGPAEIVDGSCGRLYSPGSAGSAAAGLVDVLADPGRAAALGRAGRARARARFDAARGAGGLRRSAVSVARPTALPGSVRDARGRHRDSSFGARTLPPGRIATAPPARCPPGRGRFRL